MGKGWLQQESVIIRENDPLRRIVFLVCTPKFLY